MELSIIIVNFNTRELTLGCIESIRKYPPKFDYEIIVVDNGSTDGSVDALSQDKGIKFIANSENTGFSKANNQGIGIAKGKYILLLNSDTEVTAGAINGLVEFAKKTPDAGAVASRLLNSDGSAQPSVFKFPTLSKALKQYWLGQKNLLDKYTPDAERPVEVEVAVMAAFLITPSALKKVGIFDEKYFFYFEDLDYCRRIKHSGLKVYYLPNTRVYHYHGASGKELTDEANQWRRLSPSSKIYHGILGHYLFNFVLWSRQKWEKIFKRVGLIIILAFVLRISWLSQNLFFGFEQGRDFLKLAEIASGNLALIGPGTDIPGIFHGALSYYAPLPFFLLFGGNPLLVQMAFIAINCLAIIFLYKAVEDFFNQRVAMVASLFYAISYSSIIYSRWLSNPTLVPALAIMILFFLVRARKNAWFLVPMVLSWGVVFHLEIVAAITLVVPLLFFVFFEKIKFNFKVIAICFVTAFLALSSYFVFDLKNDHILINGIRSYISAPKSGVMDFKGSFDQFANELTDNIYPENRNVALVIFWGIVTLVLVEGRKQKRNLLILLFLLISPIAYLIYGMRPQRHFFIFTPIFLAITFGLFWNHLARAKLEIMAALLFIFIALFNLKVYFLRVPTSVGNFIHHAQRMYLSDELSLIDYVYIDADGNSFSYDYYSIPYWKRESWDYLFSWYGKNKYGYLPQQERTDIFYVLIEPDEIQQPYQNEWYVKLGNDSTLISSFESGKLKAEKRIKR